MWNHESGGLGEKRVSVSPPICIECLLLWFFAFCLWKTVTSKRSTEKRKIWFSYLRKLNCRIFHENCSSLLGSYAGILCAGAFNCVWGRTWVLLEDLLQRRQHVPSLSLRNRKRREVLTHKPLHLHYRPSCPLDDAGSVFHSPRSLDSSFPVPPKSEWLSHFCAAWADLLFSAKA